MIDQKKGIIYASTAYILWGLYPLYWTMLNTIGAPEILVNRMFWSFVTLLVVIVVLRRFSLVKATLKELTSNKKKLALLIGATALLSVNWFIFMYAIISGRVLESSLGYYITPILSILIGVVVLKEKLNKYQVVAVVIASIGVLFLTITHGVFPWISILLALTWGFYALAKKIINIDSFYGLFIETSLMLPVSGFFFTAWIVDGSSSFQQGNTLHTFLLMGAGVITIIPLYFFSKAVSRLPLKTIGFLQYIGPTIQLLVAVFVIGEDFSSDRFITFGFIWVACLLFSTSHLLQNRSELKSKEKQISQT